MKNNRSIKKWVEQVLLFINVSIFVILASVNNIDNIFNIILLIVIFLINAMILKKYSKILK